MNTISSVNTLSNSKDLSSLSLSLSIQKSFSSGTYDYYVFTTGTSFTSNTGGTVEFIIIGGGGAGGGNHAGGGGAGGVAYGSVALVSGTTYTVTVGAGGTGGGNIATANPYTAANNNGKNSSIVGGSINIIAYGGGYGGGGNNGYAYNNGTAGNTGFTALGSGGGGMSYNLPINITTDNRAGVGGNGVNNASYGSAGKNGGPGYSDPGNGGGGGGAGAVGGNAGGNVGGNGGNGLSSTVLTWLPQVNATGYMTSLLSTWPTVTSNGTYIAAGGGGGSWAQNGWQPGTGGLGGGGAGGANGSGSGLAGSNGTNYTGSGGGGGASTGNVGGSGGSGLVVIRYLTTSSSTPSSNTPTSSFSVLTTIPGAILWLDANNASTLTLSGSTVTQWQDLAGNHILTGSNAVTYNATGLNSKPIISFPGDANSYFYKTTNLGITSTTRYFYYFAVLQYSSSGTGGSTYSSVFGIVDRTTNPMTNELIFYLVNTGNYYPMIINDGGTFRYSPIVINTSANNVLICLMLEYNGSSLNQTVRYNGTASSTTTATLLLASSSSTTSLKIGDSTYPGNTFKGSMYEIIMYTPTSAFTSAQIQQVEGYLAWKWGINTVLPANHLYYSTPPSSITAQTYLPLMTNSTDIGLFPQTVNTAGTVTFTTISGKQCVYFDNNISNYLYLNFSNPTQFTFCYWINAINNSYYTAFSISTVGSWSPSLQCDFNSPNIMLFAALPQFWTVSISNNSTAFVGTWVHVAYTINQSSPYTTQIYINGTLAASGNGTSSFGKNLSSFIIGKSGDNGRGFYGYIRQFQFYNTILTASQISDIYTSTA
jgi:hypothetical protein